MRSVASVNKEKKTVCTGAPRLKIQLSYLLWLSLKSMEASRCHPSPMSMSSSPTASFLTGTISSPNPLHGYPESTKSTLFTPPQQWNSHKLKPKITSIEWRKVWRVLPWGINCHFCGGTFVPTLWNDFFNFIVDVRGEVDQSDCVGHMETDARLLVPLLAMILLSHLHTGLFNMWYTLINKLTNK